MRAVWSNCRAISHRRGSRFGLLLVLLTLNAVQVFISSGILRIEIIDSASGRQVKSFLLLALFVQFGVLTVNHVNLLHNHFEVVLLLSWEKIIGIHAEDDRCAW